MRNLVESLDENSVVEEDDGPHGELVVLAEKPQKENVTWHKYQWRICVSYQKLHHVTHPFTSPKPSCDYALQDIGTEENYFSAVDIDIGYYQVVSD